MKSKAKKPAAGSVAITPPTGQMVINAAVDPVPAKTAVSSVATLKFGSVTVTVAAPSAAEVKRNVTAGQKALERVKGRLLRPGVKIAAAKGVPLYHADPDNPRLIIRELDGKTSRGTFVNGKFVKKTNAVAQASR